MGFSARGRDRDRIGIAQALQFDQEHLDQNLEAKWRVGSKALRDILYQDMNVLEPTFIHGRTCLLWTKRENQRNQFSLRPSTSYSLFLQCKIRIEFKF
jgi:hypothetical protein